MDQRYDIIIYTGLLGLCVFFSKLCTIFWRIMHPKSRIMRELCKLHNIFQRKIERFLQQSGGYLRCSKLRPFLVAMASEKNNLATKFYMSRSPNVANLATGAVEKSDCSSTGFFSNIITKPNKFNHNFCMLVFLTCFFFLLFTFLK